MRKTWVLVLAVIALFWMSNHLFAGNLEPSGPPGPTMHTLEEIYNLLKTIDVPAPVEKSGQTTSYESGDDGDIGRGISLPEPRFTDNGNDTVTDNLTGLMWTKSADIGNGGRIWTQAISDCTACITGDYEDWQLPQIKELQSLINYEYYSPSLSNTAGTGKWTEGDPFTDLQPWYYWSSTTFPTSSGTGAALYGYFLHGLIGYNGKVDQYLVWCVRGPE